MDAVCGLKTDEGKDDRILRITARTCGYSYPQALLLRQPTGKTFPASASHARSRDLVTDAGFHMQGAHAGNTCREHMQGCSQTSPTSAALVYAQYQVHVYLI